MAEYGGRCDSELRVCLGNGDIDGAFQPELMSWHSVCDGKLSATLTTPPISSITASFNVDFCTTIFSSCQSMEYELQKCSLSYTRQKYSSCICQSKLYSLEYTCEYIGNTSCVRTTAAVTDIVLYSYCSDFSQVFWGSGSITVSDGFIKDEEEIRWLTHRNQASAASYASVTSSINMTSLTVTSSLADASSVSITQPVLPGPVSSSPTAVSTKASMGVVNYKPKLAVGLAYLGIMILSSYW
jgi:hypothetical protein